MHAILRILQAMKAFIETNFQSLDFDGDGIVGAKEFRYNCITRIACDDISLVDDAFNKLLDVNTIPINPWLYFLSEAPVLNRFIFIVLRMATVGREA